MSDSLLLAFFHGSQNRQRLYASLGNTLMEYTVAAGVIAVIAVSLLLAGGNINQWMAMLRQTMHQQVKNTSTEEAEAKAYAIALKPENSIADPIVRQPVLTLEEKGNLPFEALESKIQTLGANGTTALLSNQLHVIAEKLSTEGSISQAQHDQLVKLASQGYKIAEVEALVEKAITESGGSIYKLQDSTYSFDGKTYSVEELFQSIGFRGTGLPDHLDNYSEVADNDPGIYINDFLKTYSELQTSGLTSHPEVKSIVDNAVFSISVIAETTQHEMRNRVSDEEDISVEMLKSALAREFSYQTNEYSNKICTAGNTQVSCSSSSTEEAEEEDD